MRKITLITGILFSVILFSCKDDIQDNSEILTLGTFNIAWLGDGNNDINIRTETDYKNIADIIDDTKADILGLEEIENDDAIQKLTKYLDDYDFFVGDKSGDQNPAIIFKKSMSAEFIGYFEQLEVEEGKTKPGMIFNVKKRNFDFILMVVHFKSTSRYDSTDELKELSRDLRTRQAFVLNNWINSMLNAGTEKDIIIVGDFNDYPTRVTNPTLTLLNENNNIEFITAGMMSCKYDYMSSIDHIVLSESSKTRYIQNSVRYFNFNASLPDISAEKISDHCPVLANFNILLPDND